jgi:hypothetical protein
MEITDTPKVSLIIACYNQADYLEKILYSILNQTFVQFEIVIADDGSGPEIAKIIQKFNGRFKYPIQHVWHEDAGFRKTIIVNQAVLKSKSDYLIFIDGDCILHHQFIARHYLRGKKATVLSGRRIMLDEEISKGISAEQIKKMLYEKPFFWWNHCKPKERKRGFYLPFIFQILNFSGKDYWAFGSNFSVHKTDFVEINGYDQSIIGRGLEDINLSQRFKLKGYKIKRLTYEALQYHLFHKSGSVPHSKEAEEIIIHPKHFFAENGMNRSGAELK